MKHSKQFDRCKVGHTCYIGDGEIELQYIIIDKYEDMKRLIIQRIDNGAVLSGSTMLVAASDLYFK